MNELLNEYRYFALMVGTFFEGETAILMASSLIHKGFFSGPHTILFAFAGSFISDWLYYLIGRLNGKLFLERRPKLQAKVEPVTSFFCHNKIQILLTYRFLYGFRVIIPLIIGMSKVRPSEFLFYTIVTGLIWASVVSLLGYVVGQAFSVSTEFLRHNLPLILLSFAAFGIFLGFAVKRLFHRTIATQLN
jgi:membrane protein DedA with SNARE-associated domain